jgi:hypothetical protein
MNRLKAKLQRKTCSSETSLDFQRTTQRYIPKDKSLHIHCRCYNVTVISWGPVCSQLMCLKPPTYEFNARPSSPLGKTTLPIRMALPAPAAERKLEEPRSLIKIKLKDTDHAGMVNSISSCSSVQRKYRTVGRSGRGSQYTKRKLNALLFRGFNRSVVPHRCVPI